jgi:hypothetical protein
MTDQPAAAPPPSSEPLQFDRAEFQEAAGAGTCRGCGKALVSEYFEVNGITLCPSCAAAVRASREGGVPFVRFLKASLAGGAAAIACAILWYVIRATTGYELGLIAILVGFLVGKGVMWGSGYRGGWFYQALAIALTYLSIVSTYVPLIVGEFEKREAQELAAARVQGDGGATDAVPAEPTPRPVLYVVACVISLAAPFLAGAENIMGLIIIAIALYEAWRFTKRRPFVLSGPFQIGAVAPPPRQADARNG